MIIESFSEGASYIRDAYVCNSFINRFPYITGSTEEFSEHRIAERKRQQMTVVVLNRDDVE